MNEQGFYLLLFVMVFIIGVIVDSKIIHNRQFAKNKLSYFTHTIIYFIFFLLFVITPLLYYCIQTKDQKLYSAIEDDNEIQIVYLVKNGVDINKKGFLYTPLSYACYLNKFKIAKLLIKQGADVNGAGTRTPIICAILNRNIEILKLLLIKGVKVNPDSRLRPLLYVTKDNIEILKLLSKHGATDFFGDTALMRNITDSDIEIMKILLDNHNDANTLNKENQTALDIAIENRYRNAEELLLQYGAKTGEKLTGKQKKPLPRTIDQIKEYNRRTIEKLRKQNE